MNLDKPRPCATRNSDDRRFIAIVIALNLAILAAAALGYL